MGRKTGDSCNNKSLKDRLNIVITRQQDLYNTSLKDTIFCSSIQDSLNIVNKLDIIDKVWVIGGSSIYEQCFKHHKLDKIYLTRINYNFNCDTFIKLPLMKTLKKSLLNNEIVTPNNENSPNNENKTVEVEFTINETINTWKTIFKSFEEIMSTAKEKQCRNGITKSKK